MKKYFTLIDKKSKENDKKILEKIKIRNLIQKQKEWFKEIMKMKILKMKKNYDMN